MEKLASIDDELSEKVDLESEVLNCLIEENLRTLNRNETIYYGAIEF